LPRQRRHKPKKLSSGPALWVAVVITVGIFGLPLLMVYRASRAEPADRRVALWRSTALAAEKRTVVSSFSGTQLTSLVDEFVSMSDPNRPENEYFPAFALAKLRWIFDRLRSNALSIILLEHVANTNLDRQVLMASGVVNGRQTISVVQPQFIELLAEGPGPQGPFTLEQRNDFMLALVHEAVHLQNPNFSEPAAVTREERLAEEVRAWREVNTHVVRTLRAEGQPIHVTFREVDEAFRACGDRPACHPAGNLDPHNDSLPRDRE
jgi:hypothetical protein